MTFGKHIYCIGIAGVGVSAVARYALATGSTVSGSDVRRSPLVDDLIGLGADIVFAPDPKRLALGIDAVVFSDDVPINHPERQAALERSIPTYTFAEALGLMMGSSTTRLAISGTNGKSTTTAMAGLLALDAERDPSIFVGSRMRELSGNFRLGHDDLFIAEADEYRDHFLHYRPTHAVVTNIELDHVDYFRTLGRILESFRKFIVPDVQLVVNADDPNCRELWTGRANTTWFGFGPDAEVRVVDWASHAERQEFSLVHQDKKHGPFSLRLPGKINVENAVAAMTAAHAIGIPWMNMSSTIGNFRGIWRRFEILDPVAPITVINDYAHHPTSVRGTIGAAKSFYPGRRIIAVFQPHHRHRLHALFDGFAQAFGAADITILTDVYVVAGREAANDPTPTSKDLLMAIERHDQPIIYAPTLENVKSAVADVARPGDVVLLMGAGSIWEIGAQMAKDLNHGTS